jgi:hypothetical protein
VTTPPTTTTKSTSPQPTKKAKKSKTKSKPAEAIPIPGKAQDENGDEHMTDAVPTSSSVQPTPSKASSKPTPTSTNPSHLPPSDTKVSEDFASIYLRKVTAELGDDLDKVRVAQDFNANSIPMLVKALRQGESMFGVEEKRRVVGAAGL